MQLNITNITCVNPARAVKDDVFFVIQADGGQPTRYPPQGALPAGSGEALKLPDGGLNVPYTYGVCVTAFNFRFLESNQYLFNIWVDYESSNMTETKYNNNHAEYSITRNILV